MQYSRKTPNIKIKDLSLEFIITIIALISVHIIRLLYIKNIIIVEFNLDKIFSSILVCDILNITIAINIILIYIIIFVTLNLSDQKALKIIKFFVILYEICYISINITFNIYIYNIYTYSKINYIILDNFDIISLISISILTLIIYSFFVVTFIKKINISNTQTKIQ